MIDLVPLCRAELTVRLPLDAGTGPRGRGVVAEIASARFTGRVAGSAAGASGADWLTITPDGLFLPDIRLAVRTDDGALVLLRYTGRFRRTPGEEATVLVHAAFDTGDERYRWLNELHVIGKGRLGARGDTNSYEFYEAR